MNYTKLYEDNQLENLELVQMYQQSVYLKIPSLLKGFVNEDSIVNKDKYGNECIYLKGNVTLDNDEIICDKCHHIMHINDTHTITIKHLPFGGKYSYIEIKVKQLYCTYCKRTKMQKIPFKVDKHFITEQVKNYIIDLLNKESFTNKDIAYLTGVSRNIIKEIDKERLIKKYTVDGLGKELIKPSTYAIFLGIDEFKLHKGHQFATHIVDLSTGHILWIAKGKKKKVVYDFINYVGDDWMQHVVAVACDMNSDFAEAFVDKYPKIKIVYDHFHIIKNFNEMVVSKIYKEEQSRLRRDGKIDQANSIKNSKYILLSRKDTLKKKDEKANNNKIIKKESELFNTSELTYKFGYEEKYNGLIKDNELFITIDIIKEALDVAYNAKNVKEMKQYIDLVIDICQENGNKHLLWFSKLLINHYDGIINHAMYHISTGPVEGINNKIKTIRRQHYGIPDDEYFFLKIIDASYN